MLPQHLVCSRDGGHRFEANALHSTCPHDGAPLLARYESFRLKKEDLGNRPWTMWRYREALPVADGETPVTLGEGGTPLLEARRIARELNLGVPLYVKDESQNPTGSFKARGMSVAVTCAKRLGATALVAPSAGNAGAALSAYGARAGLPVTVILPRDTPQAICESCVNYGAQVKFVEGLIDDAGKEASRFAAESGAFNVATLREPYRIEGKKTMAYELTEQLGALPSTIVYPAGGGTGLVGMWKAFDELHDMGWVGEERPRFIAVQAEGCAPIVRAFEQGNDVAPPWQDAKTSALGLRVPTSLGAPLVLRALRDSGGFAVAVSERALIAGMHALQRDEGIDASEEGGAALAGLRVALSRGLAPQGPIVLFNTGSAMNYAPRLT